MDLFSLALAEIIISSTRCVDYETGKMKTLLYLVSLFTCGTAIQQDLSGKMFTFPRQSDDSYVRLYPQQDQQDQIYYAVSVCFQFFIDQPLPLFSLSTPDCDNGFLLYPYVDKIQLYVGDDNVYFNGMKPEFNEWNSLCATWDSKTGLVQMWLNGKASVRKSLHAQGGSLSTPIIILGQEQDSYGGGFDEDQSYVGMITDVHMWDDVLSPDEIHTFMQSGNFRPGNVLNWARMDYNIYGHLFLENVLTQYNTRMASHNNHHVPEPIPPAVPALSNFVP